MSDVSLKKRSFYFLNPGYSSFLISRVQLTSKLGAASTGLSALLFCYDKHTFPELLKATTSFERLKLKTFTFQEFRKSFLAPEFYVSTVPKRGVVEVPLIGE